MKRSILFIAFALAIACGAYAQKFALIDMEYIMSNIPSYQQANDEINTLTEKRQKEVEAVMKETKVLFDEYQKNYNNLTDAQRKKREDAIVSKEKEASDLKLQYFGPEGELIKKKDALLGPIEDSIYEVVKEISLTKGYAMVLDRASASSIIFASPSIDISDEVLAELGFSN